MLNLLIAYATSALRDRKGISAMEYGILAAAIIGAIATVVTNVGSELSTIFNTLLNELTTAAAPPAG
jgi:pilus assembly protein Flp/PilA